MRVLACSVAAALLLSACATTTARGGQTATISVVASINAWGSVALQLGGTKVRATSIIDNPNTDPHDYEPTPADAKAIATASVFIENGIGYDTWAAKAVAANDDSSRAVIDVGTLTGTPDDGNPHQWYSPAAVERVADAITASLRQADAADAAYFDAQRKTFENTALAKYHQLIADIKAKYAGTAVGASESIFAPLASALGLNLVTPASFLQAVSEGTDPSPADKATIDSQIADRKIKVYVFNSQNSTPDVSAQVAAATKRGIPVSQVTETLSPQGARFQDWQVTQLLALQTALAAG